ncbi:MAG: hypothetical protein AB1757_21630 [Acidobacteriota bacterium]
MSLKPQWKEPTLGLENKWGLDKNAAPPWFMVGHREIKTLLLEFGAGKIVRSVNPRIASISDSGGGFFDIKGESPGPPTRIEVIDIATRSLEATLEVAVKRPKRQRISFHFVEDRRGDKTTHSFDKAQTVVDELNTIFTHQTNLVFELGWIDDVKVDIDLGDVLVESVNKKNQRFSDEGTIIGKSIWRKLFITKRDGRADFNVYFVPTEEVNNRNLTLFWDDTNCVIEDGVIEPEFILPHLIGRMYGCEPTSSPLRDHHLMFWDAGFQDANWASMFRRRSDNFIPKRWANLMNP